jgi:outer membrane protein assembly factor BamB
MNHRNTLRVLTGLATVAFLLAGCCAQEDLPAAEPTTPTLTPISPTHTPTSIPLTPTTTPPPTSTSRLIPTPTESAYWHYQRHDLNNTAAYSPGAWQLLDEPVILWDLEDPDYAFMGTFPVAGDLDGDDRAEYVVARSNPNTRDTRLAVFNIEDGSILWERQLDWFFDWCAPVLNDLDSDGQLDIVYAESHVGNPSPEIVALRGNDGSLIWRQALQGGGQSLAVADLDRDGQVEIIIHVESSPRRLFLLNGQDGSQIWVRDTVGSSRGVPTVADINDDGTLEVLTHHHYREPGEVFVDILVAWDVQGNKLWEFSAAPTSEQAANAPPELGHTPCEWARASSVADFNADGQLEIGWGARCQYYLLDLDGQQIWSTPTNIEGWGYHVFLNDDGTLYGNPSIHGTGGLEKFGAIGNIDEDPALEIVFPLWPEYRAVQYIPSGRMVFERLTPSNVIWALDGADGSLQWVFEGEYIDNYDPEKMFDPILVDLTGDGILDVLTISLDRHLYAIHGATGEQLLAYFFYPPPPYEAIHLTFVPDQERGILLFTWHRRGQFYTLTALHIADRVSSAP